MKDTTILRILLRLYLKIRVTHDITTSWIHLLISMDECMQISQKNWGISCIASVVVGVMDMLILLLL